MYFKRTYKWMAAMLVCCGGANAQHYQFSQFYAAPTYLNPAFTGANVCSRLSVNYRDQWSGIPGGFTTYQASFDHTLSRYKSGIGVQFFNDKAGVNGLTTTQVNLLYAYETKINKRLVGRAGVYVGTVQRRVDMGNFVFGDQIARNDAPSSLESINGNSTHYLDVGAGYLLFSRYAWVGVAAAHINEPNQSLTGDNSPLPAEIKVHGGYKYIFNETENSKSARDNNSLTLAMNYKKQQKFNQIDVGIYYSKDLLVIGCWYRGIPIFKPTADYVNNDALVFLFGISLDKYKIGYSYDLTMSKLTNASSRGAHELSVSIQFCKLKRPSKRKLVLVSCPKF